MHESGKFPTTATISFVGVQDGNFILTDLFDNSKTYPFKIQSGAGSVSFPMERWSSRAFSSNLPSPNKNWTAPVIQDSLALYWKLDEKAMLYAFDATYSKRFGKLINMDLNPAWTTGKYNGGLDFDGIDDRVRVNYNYPSTNFTQSIWFKTTSKPTYIYFVANSNNKVAGGLTIDNNGNVGSFAGTSSGKNYADGQWHNATVVLKAGIGSQLFMDGELKVAGNTDKMEVSNNTFEIGGFDWWGHFKGTLDEVRLFTKAFSATEVNALYIEDITEIPVTEISNKGKTQAQYSTPSSNYEKVRVFDLFGREVLQVVNEFQGTGSKNFNISSKQLPKGIYFVKSNIGGKKILKQVLVK